MKRDPRVVAEEVTDKVEALQKLRQHIVCVDGNIFINTALLNSFLKGILIPFF